MFQALEVHTAVGSSHPGNVWHPFSFSTFLLTEQLPGWQWPKSSLRISSKLGEPVGKFPTCVASWYHRCLLVPFFFFNFKRESSPHQITWLLGICQRIWLIFISTSSISVQSEKEENLLAQTWRCYEVGATELMSTCVLFQSGLKYFWKAVESIKSFCSFPKEYFPPPRLQAHKQKQFSKRVALQS